MPLCLTLNASLPCLLQVELGRKQYLHPLNPALPKHPPLGYTLNLAPCNPTHPNQQPFTPCPVPCPLPYTLRNCCHPPCTLLNPCPLQDELDELGQRGSAQAYAEARAAGLGKEVRALQEALAEHNLVIDKVRWGEQGGSIGGGGICQ